MLKFTTERKRPRQCPYSLCVREKDGNYSMKILDIKISFPAIRIIDTSGHFLGVPISGDGEEYSRQGSVKNCLGVVELVMRTFSEDLIEKSSIFLVCLFSHT